MDSTDPGIRGRTPFSRRYGPWALVAGASEGLGAAFANALAERGMNVFLVARREALLRVLAEDIRTRLGVEVKWASLDLAGNDFADELRTATKNLEISMVVYNAGFAPVGEFCSASAIDLRRLLDVNTRGPVELARTFLPPMAARKRGAMIFMSSLAGNQGSPRIAAYAATKAFNRVLAEGLWHELRSQGVDVVACCAGAIRTPGYSGVAAKEAPGTMDPRSVVEQALRGLGRGPVVVPGIVNKMAALFTGRLLPKRAAIGIMALSTNDLSSANGAKASA